MRTYQQLTQEQRYQIYALKKKGPTQTLIAGVVAVHRELKRNTGQRGYRQKQAQRLV